ncbi:V-set and immunoglobulin domain-containing protein 10 [Aplochiton taeniatus]
MLKKCLTGVPKIESAAISPATHLSNGTLFVYKGSNVSFNCSGASYPSQNLFWSFQGVSSSNDSLASGSSSWLGFRIEDIQPSSQGEYSCIIRNPLSNMTANWSTQLLVYHAPERHPECLWKIEDPSHVQFNCSWSGGYPSPSLHWGENHHGPGNEVDGSLLVAGEADSVVVSLNRSLRLDGLTLKCQGHHPALSPEKERSCSLSLKSPNPEVKPFVTVLEGSNVTLTCTEANSLPPASTTWRRTNNDAVVSGSRFILSQEGPNYQLTIVNVTKEDEGFYLCHSENLLMVQAQEVHLTVKLASSAYTGAIIGIFLAVMIVGTGIVTAKLMYASRDRICLGKILFVHKQAIFNMIKTCHITNF